MEINHESFMRRCIQLGHLAMKNGNPPVGSVLVLDGIVISEACEEADTTGDVTDHAEIIAIRKAMHKLDKKQWASALLYSTHEPCVMCAYAIRQYGIGTIVFGCKVPHAGGYSSKYNLLCEAGHPSWKVMPVIKGGMLVEECLALTKAYEKTKKKYTS
jgi:tRNA(adenine34) deaminase